MVRRHRRPGPPNKSGLPQGVRVVRGVAGEKYSVNIHWDKVRCVGTFDAVGTASSAFEHMRKARDESGDRSEAAFQEARKKAVAAAGGCSRVVRDLPRGVSHSDTPGKYVARIRWGKAMGSIGHFDSVGTASSAFEHMRKMREEPGDRSKAAFQEARKKAVAAVGGARRKGLLKEQRRVVKIYIARHINDKGKLMNKTSGQILDNLVAMVASDEDDRAVLKKQIQRYIWHRCSHNRHENDDASVASGATGATDMSFVGDNYMDVLASDNFGRTFDKDSSSSSDDDGSIVSTMPALGAGDDAISNLATLDDRKPAAKRGYAEI